MLMKMQQKKPERMAKHHAPLVLLIALCTFLGTAGAQRTFVLFDYVIPGDQAARFLATGKFPEKSAVSSLGSYIPPGTAWLEIPGIALRRPLFLPLPAAAILFVTTLLGIYLLANACDGPWTGCAAVALFSCYANGMFWAHSIWPRAHPVCYVWITLFTLWWVKRRQSKFLFAAVLILLLGLSIHLELLFAALPLVITWFWLRPPIGKYAVPAAIACALIVWLPYLRFEATRHFIDLRSQLLSETLTPLDTAVAFPQMIEQFDEQAQQFKPFDGSTTWEAEPTRSPLAVLRDFLPSAYSNFRKSQLIATTIVAIGVIFLATAQLALGASWTKWAGEKQRLIAIVCLSLAVPWFLLAITTRPNAPFRQWGLWSLQSIVACIGASFLLSLPRGRWVAFVLIAAWANGDGSNVAFVAASIAREGWAGRECGEARICDMLASAPDSKSLRVGYFTVFTGFELGQAPGEPTQKIGIQFDRYLRWRYGIENLATTAKGYGDDDEYRILQTIPTGLGQFRFKPDLSKFTRIAQADQFELWQRANQRLAGQPE